MGWEIHESVKERLKMDEFTIKRIEKIMSGHSDNKPLLWCDYCQALNHASEKYCKGCDLSDWYNA